MRPAIPRSNVDDVIEYVLNQACGGNEKTRNQDPCESKRWLSCIDDSDVEIMEEIRMLWLNLTVRMTSDLF